MKSKIIESLLYISCLVLPIFAGCSSKAYTKPRSLLITEAESNGQPIHTVEADKAIFDEYDKQNRERLLKLIGTRSSKEDTTSYKIGPFDEVEVHVFDVSELNLTSRISEAGYLTLPLIGGIEVKGMTDSALKDEITLRLKKFVRNPQVTVFISGYGSQKVAVLGAVRKPGTYPLKKGASSLIELVSDAGGLTPKAGNFVSLIPAEETGLSGTNDLEGRARLALDENSTQVTRQKGIEVSLDQVAGTSGGIPIEVPVKGGDIVMVPEAGQVLVDGEVAKVGAFDLGQQMTLLGALAAAGGITYGAKIDEVEIVRDFGLGKRASLLVNLEKLATGEESDIRLRNGDIVRVPSDSGRRLRQDTFESISRVLNFGIGGHVDLSGP